MSNREYLYDRAGRIIGRMQENEIYDRQGRFQGRFDGGKTYDRAGKMIGTGDQRPSLIKRSGS